MRKVYLGGTCNESTWRDALIKNLKIDYFNPVIENWTPECQAEEIRQRQECDLLLYVITPKMTGVYAVAEVVQDSNKSPDKTIFCVLPEDGDHSFDEGDILSLSAVSEMVERNGAVVFGSLEAVTDYLNSFFVEIAYNPNLIECLIERDGTTEISLKHETYRFEKNRLGDNVCLVLNGDHRKYLLFLPDFRIYQGHLAPKKDFTDEERNFKQEWERLSADNFLAYVNGHIGKLNSSSLKIRKIASGKWQSLLSHMGCPINIEDGTPLSVAEPIKEKPEPEEFPVREETGPKDLEFQKKWKTLAGIPFEKFVLAHEDEFLELPEGLYETARAKWAKLVEPKLGKGWPFDDEEDTP